MSVNAHKEKAPSSIRVSIITVSDTRTLETDKSGALMEALLKENGHIVLSRNIVKDEQNEIRSTFLSKIEEEEVQAVLINGGTGLARRDVTIETISSHFEKEISGFGELFRMLSYQEDIGSAAMLSRATGGTKDGKAIFITPGSTGAVRLAMEKLILPELSHIILELNK
ncbi:MogA/MoaB family molybdenum cofactor biosynthesis protein [Falsibacillus pallidus]|uniref:Molybdenum cofactor biosynthesis protein B n=1 Tax=Falsibacillus pallidus TaxID=493781 RepID=A0A370GKH4_9BACI|nr:molybdenum cofactor biosynthesis protein B [Falsibacillus pallidus]RDI44272.1 molybdopterin adenylyltransferase [Falsibacillus pallidus]